MENIFYGKYFLTGLRLENKKPPENPKSFPTSLLIVSKLILNSLKLSLFNLKQTMNFIHDFSEKETFFSHLIKSMPTQAIFTRIFSTI
jgi:hypothetical protein